MNFGGAFSKKREKPQKNRLKLSLKNNKLVLKTKKMQKNEKNSKKVLTRVCQICILQQPFRKGRMLLD